jgi:hypothetical protein
MNPEDMLHHHTRRAAQRQPQPGERLFEFLVGPNRYRCELRDHGAYGLEAQFFENEQFWYSRRFDGRLDPTRTPRALAVEWAETERAALEAGSGGAP